MAQALFQRRILDELEGTGMGYRVLSAGVFAQEGNSASADAIKAMEEEGLDLSWHDSVQLNPGLIRAADLILTMTNSQRDYVRLEFPKKAGFTFTINEYAGGHSGEVLDPYGLGLDAYRACRDQLEILVDELFGKIIESKMG